MFPVAITNEQKAVIVAAPKTAAGNPAALDGPLRVTVVSGDATIEQDPALPAQVKLVSGAAGVSEFLVEADADLGEGVRLISETVVLTVTAAEASSLGFSVAVEPK